MMYFDAFSEDVRPGGLKNTSEIKLLICYILKCVDVPLDREHVISVIRQKELANYFEITAAIEDLLDSGNIVQKEICGAVCYTLTPSGKEVTSLLENSLPPSVRDKAKTQLLYVLSRLRFESENEVSVQKLQKGAAFDCRITDGESDMMHLQLRLSDEEQAAFVKERFLRNPVLFYNAIFALLAGDKQALTDVFEELQTDIDAYEYHEN